MKTKTLLTQEDIKNIFKNLFYEAENDEGIAITDEYETETEESIQKFLNVNFYSWKERVVDRGINEFEQRYVPFESWANSLNVSLNTAYALVETDNAEATPSEDIDSASIEATVTFIIQTNKISTLDYYCAKLKNAYLGKPNDIINIYGDKVKAYFHIGSLLYDQEPEMTQMGEVIICSLKFLVTYLEDARNYTDTEIYLALNKETEPTNEEWEQMPFTKLTWQALITSTPVPTQKAPYRLGFLGTSVALTKTFSFFDFNKSLTNKFNSLFWRLGAYKINETVVDYANVNIPIWIKVVSEGNVYIYKDMVETLEKVISNSDFNVCSITLKGYGKL